MGIAMSSMLLAENRHRHNQRCSEQQREGYPMIGHYDTWLVDLLQRLVNKNHNITLYPYWSNASDFKDTNESFDTIALHSSDLHKPWRIDVRASTQKQLSSLGNKSSYARPKV